MPLTDEQKQAITVLAGADPKEATEALKDGAHPLFQSVFRKGYGTAQGEYEGETGKLTKAQAEAAAAKARAEKAEADLTEARSKTPDVDKLHADYGTKLKEKDDAIAAERTARENERKARIRSDLRAELGVINDSGYADYLASTHIDRLTPKDDGTVELLEAAGSSVPVQVPQGKTPYKVLAEDILKDVAPDKKRSDVDAGGGAQGGSGGGNRSADDFRKATEGTVNYQI